MGPKDIPWSETLIAPKTSSLDVSLDKLWVWVIVAILLILITYGPFFASSLPPRYISPGFRFF